MPFKSVVEQTHIVTESTSTLSGMNIPNPALNQGAIVHVVETGNFYGLVLDSTKEIDGVNVLSSIIGGNTKWLLLNIAAGQTPPLTSGLYAFGRVDADGTKLSGERFTVVRLSEGIYIITFTGEEAATDAAQFAINITPHRIILEDVLPVIPNIANVSLTGFQFAIKDTDNNLIDAQFSFVVVIGSLA